MRRWLELAMVVLALSLTGCTSVLRLSDCRRVSVEPGLTPIELVEITNTNWLLLSSLPIASGDPDNPNDETTQPFSNTVTLENQMKMLEAEVRRVGARKAVNVVSLKTHESAFFILFRREKYHTMAVLVR